MSLLVVYSGARGKSLPRVSRWWVREGASPSGPNSAAVALLGGPTRPPHPHPPHWGKKTNRTGTQCGNMSSAQTQARRVGRREARPYSL